MKIFCQFFVLVALLISFSFIGVSQSTVYWDLDNGCPVSDSSSNSFTGTCNGNPTTGVTGAVKQAFSFDGSDDYVYNNSVSIPGSISQNIWYKLDTVPTESVELISHGESGNVYDAKIGIVDTDGDSDYNDLLYRTYDGSNLGSVAVPDAVTGSGEWQMVTLVYDGTDLKAYKNATQVGSTSAPRSELGTSFLIGARANGPDAFFSGALDEARIYDGAWTESEIQTFYDDGENSAPLLSDPFPVDGSTGVSNTTDLEIKYSDSDGDSGTVTFKWKNGPQIYQETNVASGSTVSTNSLNLNSSTLYSWQVEASDGVTTTKASNYSFTTSSTSSTLTCNGGNEELIHYYMNDTDSTVTDYSSSKTADYFGTLNGGYTQGVNGLTFSGCSDDGTAIDFGGVDGYLETDSEVSISDEFTAFSWYNVGSSLPSSRSTVFSHGSVGGPYDMKVAIEDTDGDSSYDDLSYKIYDGSTITDITLTDSVTADEWVSVGLVYDGSRMIAYKNGNTVGNKTGSFIEQGTFNVVGGKVNGVNDFFNGKIDEYRLFSRGLNSTEIASLNNSNTLESVSGSISLSTPETHQPFQVNLSTGNGIIDVEGTYTGSPNSIEARFDSGNWKTVDANPSSGSFSGSINESKGAGTIEVRFSNDTSVSDSVDDVGVEMIVGLSLPMQSNGPTHGNTLYNISNQTGPDIDSRFYDWRNNRYNVTVDRIFGTTEDFGSPWINVSRRISENYNVNVTYIPVYEGGSCISSWLNGSRNYNNFYNAVQDVTSGSGDIGMIISNQGECDAKGGTTFSSYSSDLEEILNDSRNDFNVKYGHLVSTTVTEQTSSEYPTLNEVRKAQKQSWDLNNVYAGANPINVTAVKDDVHYSTDSEISELADQYMVGINGVLNSSFSGRGPSIVGANTSDNQTIYLNFDKELDQSVDFNKDIFRFENGGVEVSIDSASYFDSDTVEVNLSNQQGSPPTVSFGYYNDQIGKNVLTNTDGAYQTVFYDEQVQYLEQSSDTTAPTSTDNWTDTGFVDKSEVPIELSASDNDGGSGVKEISYRTCKDSDCSIPIRDWTTVSGSSVNLLLGSFNSDEKGNVTVQYNATDNSGNVEASNKEYVAFEKGKSAINLSTPSSGDVFSLDNSSSTLIDFNGSIENDNFVLDIYLYLNGTEVESVSPDNGFKPNFNFSRDLGEANHTYSVEWKSGYTGKFYRSDPVSFEVANSSEIVEKNVLEACSNVDESNEFCLENGTYPVSFDSGFTPRDNTSISYNVSAPSSSTGSSVFYGFANSSSTVFSTVESGNVTVSVEENTSGNDAPSASFTANSTSVLTGESIEFDASGSSDIDGSISSYSWNFGDSSTGSGEVVTHSYSSTGDYVVELTVTDDDGVSTSVNTTVSVSSDSDDGGGGGGGDGSDDGSTDDDNTSTGGTAGLGNISAGLQSPHVDANYFFETFSVMLNESKTVTLDGVEETFELTEVYNESSAGIRQSGNFKEVSEGDLLTVDNDEVAVSDVIDNGNESQIVLSLKDDQNQGSKQGEVIFFYNYSTSSSEEYNVSVQYRETGIGKDWKTADNTTVNSVQDNTQGSVTVSSLKESIYEARVVVENGTDNVSTTPVGFAVGYVPEINLVAPPNNAEVTRSPPVTTLPIAFTARTIESTDFGGFYVGPSGERYSAGELIEENLRINGSSSDTLDFKLSGALGFFEWLPFFTVNEYGSFVDAFGIPGGTDFFAEFDMSVPVQEGTYTAYVNASSNDTSFSFNTTSSGRSVLLNVKDLENSNRTTEISNSFEQDTGKTVTNDPVTDESFNSTQTFDNETYYFSSPAVLLRGPRGNYTLDDLSSGEINFNFAMSHEGQFLANRTVVIEANDSVVDKIGLETDDTEYDFNISGSQLSNGSWNESNYSYFVQFENSTDVIWSSKGRTDGELSFQVEEASKRPELTGNFFEDLLIVLNPLTYGQTVATVVSLLLTVLTGVLLRNYREVALAGMVSTLIATVALGWTPTWIGLIIFIGGFLVFSDKAGRVIG